MQYGHYSFDQITDLLNKIGGEEAVERLMAGDWKVAPVRHVIDTKREPYYDDEFFGLKIHHPNGPRDTGLLLWDAAKVEIWQPKHRKWSIADAQSALRNRPALNARVRDYLLDHPELVPAEWNSKVLCFFGTTFCSNLGDMLPTMQRKGGQWRNVFEPFNLESGENKFSSNMVALIEAA